MWYKLNLNQINSIATNFYFYTKASLKRKFLREKREYSKFTKLHYTTQDVNYSKKTYISYQRNENFAQKLSNPYFFATWMCKPLIFQT